MKIPLTKGMFAIVDLEDFDKVNQFKWTSSRSQSNKWYAKATVKKGQSVGCKSMIYHRKDGCDVTTILLHWLILDYKGELDVDHINGNRLDNRKSNLRLCTHSQNLSNRGKQCNNTSGYKGVYLDKRDGAWYYQIRGANRKLLAFARFKTPIEAARAYDTAVSQHYGEFARLNFRRS